MKERPKLDTSASDFTPPTERSKPSFLQDKVKFDGKTGQILYQDAPIGQEALVSILFIREHRTLWSWEYDKSNPGIPVCVSADGRQGYGIARRLHEDEQPSSASWRGEIIPRQCRRCDLNQWSMAHKHGKAKHVPPVCQPESDALIVIRGLDSSDPIKLAIAENLNNRKTEGIVDQYHRQLREAGSRECEPYMLAGTAVMEKYSKGQGFGLSFDQAWVEWSEQEVDFIASNLEEATNRWKDNRERAFDRMRRVGHDKDTPESELPSLDQVLAEPPFTEDEQKLRAEVEKDIGAQLRDDEIPFAKMWWPV